MPVDLREFGHYHLIRRVSLGGMAEVFKAKCFDAVGFEKIVALKRLLPNVAQNQDFIEMFLEEAKIAAQLEHENICPIFELGKHGESYYITMEFIYGHDLRKAFKATHARKERIDPWIIAWIGIQVARGLEYAYNTTNEVGDKLNVVHRDISPQNVMIGFDGAVNVIDFGIAKAATSTVQTAAGILKGKYAYMSPEHAGRQKLDQRSDIWSLGIVLYELLAGKRLFVGEVVADIIDQVLHRPIEPLQQAPEGLATLIHQMLDRDLTRRPQSHQEVVDALSQILDDAPTIFDNATVASWMDDLFPSERRMEEDLTNDDVALLMSAEERGETTTDQRSDISEATQIFLADVTGHTDYRALLERMIADGRVHTLQETDLPKLYASPSGGLFSPSLVDVEPRELFRDAVWSALGLMAVTWLLLGL